MGVLALALASARSALADTVQGTTAFSSGISVTANSNGSIKFANGSTSSLGTSAGTFTSSVNAAFNGMAANQNFSSFCVDLGQYIGSTLKADISISGPSASTDQSGNSRNIGAAAWVVNNFVGLSNATYLADAKSINSTVTSMSSSEIAAGIQMAVWKAAYNGTNTDLTDSSGGNKLWFTGTAAGDLGAEGLAQYIINHLGSNTSTAIFLNFSVWSSANQDQIAPGVVTPEPSTLAIAGIGLLGLAGYGLRRNRRQV
jgi:hypothetical protein